MPNLRILLDLDGVLKDFHLGYLTLRGKEAWMDSWPQPGVELTDCLGIAWESVFDLIKPGFFAGLTKTPFCDDLIKLVEEYDPLYHICTSPGPERDGVDYIIHEKVDWVHRNIDKRFNRFLITHDKTIARGYGNILIDDYDAWCQKFEAARGLAIVCPRPWNSRHSLSHDPLMTIRLQLEHFKHIL